MLSYRHAFHAGNFADVLKHAVLANILEYITRKDKGYTYIDSHSGAGMYQLKEEFAQKTGEYKQGIAKLINENDIPEPLEEYISLIQSFNDEKQLELYPGSPAVAKEFSRRQDSAHLFDLHSTDINHLTQFCERWNKSHVKQSDGYQGILSLLPPPSRRGVVLIDPPYELKEDYSKAVKTITSAYKKFATGTYILWYPVVKRELIDKMAVQFKESDVKNLLQVEFCMQADTDSYGMTGTGLFIVNPPWLLTQQLEEILPYLKTKIGSNQSSYSLQQLIEE